MRMILKRKNKKHNIEVIVDRLVVKPEITSRLSDSIATASKLSNGIIPINISYNIITYIYKLLLK